MRGESNLPKKVENKNDEILNKLEYLYLEEFEDLFNTKDIKHYWSEKYMMFHYEMHMKEEDFKNPNVVKAVYSPVSRQCLYFSRQSLPYDRDGGREYSWYQHIGVYSYKPLALSSFVKLPMSPLEDLEKLEQLRALESQMTLGAILTTQKLIGVDVPEDIKKVEGALL